MRGQFTVTDPAPALRRLNGRRGLARAAIVFEALWPALWPPLGVAGLFLVAALLDLPARLPVEWHIVLLVVTGLAILGLLIRGLRGVHVPDNAAADRRLELASGLTHRPLSVLTDRPSQTDAVGQALWQAHLARTARQISSLRVGAPRPGLARRDRIALRGALVVALVAAFAIAGRDAPNRVAVALEPSMPRPAAPQPAEWQAWITPPAYTRMAPIFLKSDVASATAPTGSQLTANVTGGTSTPQLSLSGRTQPFQALDQTSFQAERTLADGGRLAIRREGRDLAAWEITIVADLPPVVAWADKPGPAPAGQQLRLPWRASDDYGVASLKAELRLDARPDAEPLAVPIPLPGGTPKTASSTNQQDLTAHPWAGLPVRGLLTARDAAGQTGTSEELIFTLPERAFQHPIARALIEMRKGLSVHPDDRSEALAGLDILMLQRDFFANDPGAYLNLSALYYLLVRQKGGQVIPDAQERMWLLALHMEEGQTEQTARTLELARQAARDALDRATQDPTDANRQALEERLKELQDAINRHMQAMLEEARRNQTVTPFDPDTHALTNHDLDRLAERAREAAREGRMDEAQRRVEELEQLLDQMRNARANPGQEQNQQSSNQRRQRGRQQMGAVQDMIGRQGGVLDKTEGRADQNSRPRAIQPPAASADGNAQREADRRVQQALRRALGELMQQFGDLTGEVPPSLTEADQAMRESATQLGQGQDRAAGEAQQHAIEALQKGAREMGQAMARQFGPGQGNQEGEQGEGEGEGQPQMGAMMQDGRGEGRSASPIPGSPRRARPEGRDPLGRYNQGTASNDGDVVVPEERERQRTQAIQEELRRRGADQQRPRQELDYIDRLLKQF